MVADIPSVAMVVVRDDRRATGAAKRPTRTTEKRRFRIDDALTEVPVVPFESQEGFESYLADEKRQSHKELVDGLDVAQRVLLVGSVEVT